MSALKNVFEGRELEDALDTFNIEAIQVTPSKAGIIAALNLYGGHPDNG